MNYLSARLREPSTWAGIASVLGMAAHAWATRDYGAIAGVLAGVVAIAAPEGRG